MEERAGLAGNIFQNNNFPILQLYGKHVQNNLVCFRLQNSTETERIILVIQTSKNLLLFHPCILLIYYCNQ